MTTPEDKERELNRREAELQAKERELRLRELETQIYREQEAQTEVIAEPPLYQTRKEPAKPNSIQKFGRKLVRFAKFAGFVVAGIAIIKVGFFVGMWVTYFLMAGMIAAIGYQIFLKDN